MFQKLKLRFLNENVEDEYKFRCVNCGHRLKELYKTYSPTISKLAECDRCGKVADKLIEFEALVIIIDLILLSTKAQRHVLYNTSCKNLYKILMVITLLESYCLLESFDKNRIGFSNRDDSSKDPLYMEKGFYLATIQIVLCKWRLLVEQFIFYFKLLSSSKSLFLYNHSDVDLSS
jgi:Arv1-like family